MKLTKIKLINWHMFVNDTIEIKGNTLVTGQNGSGKSTFSDAIFYVLSGGDDKYFNNAANISAERTVETYLRAKIGSENNKYLRNDNEIIGHIALEFNDETYRSSFVLGVTLELLGGSKVKPKFYSITNYKIKEEDYIQESSISNFSTLKSIFKKIETSKFIDLSTHSLKDRKKAIVKDLFQLENQTRYNELLKKAIAFRPIDKVSTFVDDFLLKDDKINIETLRDEIRSYSEIKNSLDKENDKINYLKGIIDKLERFVGNDKALSYFEVLKLYLEIQENEDSIKRLHADIIKGEAKLSQIEKELDSNDREISDGRKEKSDLENDENYRVLNEKIRKYEALGIAIENLRAKVDQVNRLIENENKIVRKLGLNYRFNKDITDENYPLLKLHLVEYENDIKNKTSEFNLANSKENYTLERENEGLLKQRKELADLNKGINNYRDKEMIDTLIQLIKNELKNKYRKEIEVRPLCEYLEINDPAWTDAIEGYLNTQRFDLIIEPKYFKDALEIYEKYKKEKRIYGVGIIHSEAGFFEKFKGKQNSLFEKLKIENKYAEAAAFRILNDVIAVENVHDLVNYDKAITKTCMVFKNHVARNINPTVYLYPFIGKNSITIRKNILIDSISKLEKSIAGHKKIVNDNNELLEAMKSTQIIYLLNIEDYWSELKNETDIYHKLDDDIQLSKKDKGLLALDEQIKRVTHKLKSLYEERTRKNGEKTSLSANMIVWKDDKDKSLKNKEESEQSLKYKKTLIKDESNYEQFHHKYLDNGRLLRAKIEHEEDSARKYNNAVYADLDTKTLFYVNNFNHSLTADRNCYEDFINEYYTLVNRNLVEFNEKATRALEMAQNSFKSEFISKLYDRIEEAQKRIKNLNKNLRNHPFGTDQERFEFTYDPADDDEMAGYYRIITSGKVLDAKNLFEDELDGAERTKILELYNKISTINSGPEFEKSIERYLDYRTYMKYDIKTTNKNGDISYFSKTSKEKSGGETQTPFYVIIAACFDELMIKNRDNESTCTVIFDEAFNNMDESRIHSLMEFYNELNIQLIIVVPTNRMPALAQSVDSIRSLTKIKHRIYIGTVDNGMEK